MKTALITTFLFVASGSAFALMNFVGVTPVTNSPPITYFTETDSAPTELGLPLIPVGGSIHINGQVAFPVLGLMGGGLITDNVAQTTYQRWASPNLPNIAVERVILINGVEYKDDTRPLIIVWTAILPPPAGPPPQYPIRIELLGNDFNCSGGGVSVTP